MNSHAAEELEPESPRFKFVAIDFETATRFRNSACAVGAVFVEYDENQKKLCVVDKFSSLIKPPGNKYDGKNISIHGITPARTASAKTFDVVWRALESRMDGHLVVAHNASFDISVVKASAEARGLSPRPFEFLCTYRLAKSHWPTIGTWKLNHLSDWANLPLENHHDALSDAIACAHLAIKLHEEGRATDKGGNGLLALVESYNFQIGEVNGSSYAAFSKLKKKTAKKQVTAAQLPGVVSTEECNQSTDSLLPSWSPPTVSEGPEAEQTKPKSTIPLRPKVPLIPPHITTLSKPAITVSNPPSPEEMKENAILFLRGKKADVATDGLWVFAHEKKTGESYRFSAALVEVKGRKLILPGKTLRLRGTKRRDRRRLRHLIGYGGEVGESLHTLVSWSQDLQSTVFKATENVQWVPVKTVDALIAGKPDLESVKVLKSKKLAPLLKQRLEEAFEDLDRDLKEFFTGINRWVLKTEKVRSKEFFDTIEKNPLTEEQIEAVVAVDNSVQVVASAGSGKTSLMVARAAYAVHRGFCAPEEILLLAFNRDAADELAERVSERFEAAGIPSNGVRATTFHSFGLGVIAEATGAKPRVAPWLEHGRELHEVESIVSHLKEVDEEFNKNWEMFKIFFADSPKSEDEARPDRYNRENKHGVYITADGKYVRSYGEKKIADWLYFHGIDYEYEKQYKFDTATARHSQYRPDFYYPQSKTWHEHWGLDQHGNPPPKWEGYLEGIEWKKDLHLKHNTDLIETTYHSVVYGNGLEVLLEDLAKRGITGEFDPSKPNQTPYPVKDEKVVKLVRTFMSHFKSGRYSKQQIEELARSESWKDSTRTALFLEVYWAIHDEWHSRLDAGNYVDFEDMLLSAADHLYNFDYAPEFEMVLVDEMQDSSKARAELVKGLISQSDKFLLAVGDDWQSINRFAGADIGVMTNFESYFGKGPVFSLTKTFRCGPEICAVSSAFISRNGNQIRKTVVPVDNEPRGPVTAVHGSSADDAFVAAMKLIKDDANSKGVARPTVLALGRYNYDIALGGYRDNNELSSLERMLMSSSPAMDIKFMSIHKSKGLEADYVVVVNNQDGTHGFPSQIGDDEVLSLVIPADDGFEHSEERRLMYVALTRAKQRTFLLVDEGSISIFVKELSELQDSSSVSSSGGVIAEPEGCPKCERGVLSLKKTAESEFLGCSKFPSCDFRRWPKPSGAESCRHCETGFYRVREGKYGSFLGCSEYPGCRSTRNITSNGHHLR